ncbi:hypothetical protein [Sulfitobacter sp. 20_GPM-1509m]|uniref:hypothetical protein n=1 Tax=Sulfitobacter sp. 20_GPM-1509m TaxID=1380367 RepID=UPI00048EC937|nr:hypothetical protein [Sulfitobacter sp. 20_GPM-1509m]
MTLWHRIIAWAFPKRPLTTDEAIQQSLNEAAAGHYHRNGVDPYDLSGPIASAADQLIADNLPDRFRSVDGDMEGLK